MTNILDANNDKTVDMAQIDWTGKHNKVLNLLQDSGQTSRSNKKVGVTSGRSKGGGRSRCSPPTDQNLFNLMEFSR